MQVKNPQSYRLGVFCCITLWGCITYNPGELVEAKAGAPFLK